MTQSNQFDFKNASKEELDREYKRIAREVGDDRFFTKKELRHLPEILLEGPALFGKVHWMALAHRRLTLASNREELG